MVRSGVVRISALLMPKDSNNPKHWIIRSAHFSTYGNLSNKMKLTGAEIVS